MGRLDQPQPALGAAIRQLRDKRGVTQEDLAHDATVTTGTLSLIERGKSNPAWGTVKSIATALGVSVAEVASSPRSTSAEARLRVEGARDQRRVVLARRKVEVAHRGLHLGVAHPLLDAANVGLGDDAGAEGVAQVVEAEAAQPGAIEGVLVAAAERATVEEGAGAADEDEIVVGGPQGR